MKAVLISIHPEWCKLIASGKKTIEVRKNRPKLETPFKCYIYCTEQKRRSDAFNLEISHEEMLRDMAKNGMKCMDKYGNGKVWGEFVCDQIYKFSTVVYLGNEQTIHDDDLVNAACISRSQLRDYEGTKPPYGLYGWHISGLKIYDSPLIELAEFRHFGDRYHYNPWITRPPQSWCYVEVPG